MHTLKVYLLVLGFVVSWTLLPTFAQTTVVLVEGAASGDFNYTLAGTGSSSSMMLTIRNKTEQTWIVEVEIGTKLEPDEANTQNMVVTKEVHVKMHPHEHQTIEIEAACLDISKAPPGKSTTSWTIQTSGKLAAFIKCTNRMVDDAKDEDARSSDIPEHLRPTLTQFGLWEARGATREQWVDFWVEYQGATKAQAKQLVDSLKPLLSKITAACPSV